MTAARRCRFCPNLLLTEVSRARGYGPVCGRRRGLIPPPAPRRRPAAAAQLDTGPTVHPDQLVIPVQPMLPQETTT